MRKLLHDRQRSTDEPPQRRMLVCEFEQFHLQHIQHRPFVAEHVAAPLKRRQHPENLTGAAARGIRNLGLAQSTRGPGEQLENVEPFIEGGGRILRGCRHYRSAFIATSIRRAISRLMVSGTGCAPGSSVSATIAMRSSDSA